MNKENLELNYAYVSTTFDHPILLEVTFLFLCAVVEFSQHDRHPEQTLLNIINHDTIQYLFKVNI